MRGAVSFVNIIVFTFLCIAATAATAPAQETVAKQCIRCHGEYQGRDNIIAGTFVNKSNKAKTLQVKVGLEDFIIKLTDETIIDDDPTPSTNTPVTVRFRMDGPDYVAEEVTAMAPLEVPREELIFAEDLAEIIEGGEKPYTLVDSRPTTRYRQGHIPTAISIPLDQMEAMKAKLPQDKSELLIFYCGGPHCTLSPMAAEMARNWGYTNIRVYHAGAPDWADLGKVMLTTHHYLIEHPSRYVLVDTRGVEAAVKGRLPGAVAMDPETIENSEAQFPLDRKAPIVLYDASGDLGALAPLVELFTIWGYRNIYVVDGGYRGWTAAGQPVETGEPSTHIVYAPKPLPGEIGADEFAHIVEYKPADTLILDVRTPTEAAAGAIPGSLNLPVDELRVRMDEIPKNKEIVVHCASGMRAEMGYTILTDAGYDARFLNDTIAIVGKKLYLGTTLTLADEAGQDEPLPEAGAIEIATPDAALCARLIRFGQTAMERRKYLEAKQFFWKAIMADPTSQLAWTNYDMSVIYALANQAEQSPGTCVGIPDAPVTEPSDAGGLGGMKEEEGC